MDKFENFVATLRPFNPLVNLDETQWRRLLYATAAVSVTALVLWRVAPKRPKKLKKELSKPRRRIPIMDETELLSDAKILLRSQNASQGTGVHEASTPVLMKDELSNHLNQGTQNGSQRNEELSALNAATVRNIVTFLLELPPVSPPVSAFRDAVAAVGGKAASSGTSFSMRHGTVLPPFNAQIDHVIKELKESKIPGRPLLLEGPPGLGKGTAMVAYLAEQGESRPAVYLSLSSVLGKGHGSSNFDDEDEGYDEDIPVSYSTETETEVEGEEKVPMTIDRKAFLRGLCGCLGYDIGSSECSQSSDSEESKELSSSFDDTPFRHISQALSVISSRCKAGPAVLVIDDIQLLFCDRLPLTSKYDGIEQAFQWLLSCESKGILEVVFVSSDKSAVGGIKRFKGYAWGLKLHSVECVDDDVVISYLLSEVNPLIRQVERRFTADTAALFVATFDGSLLELDSYFRDSSVDVGGFIRRRERALYRRLQKTLPSRLTGKDRDLKRRGSSISSHSSSSTSALSMALPAHLQQETLTSEEELRELFLDITMRGGVLPVAKLDVRKMGLVEDLVECNILRWRDSKVRRRESRLFRKRMEEEEKISLINRSKFAAEAPLLSKRLGSGISVSNRWDSGGTGQQNSISTSLANSWFGGGATASLSDDGLPPGPSWDDVADNEWHDQESKGASDAQADASSDPAIDSALSYSNAEGVSKGQSVVTPIDFALDDQWAGAESSPEGLLAESRVKDMDASEQLALFAMEDAELVWSNRLVKNVCEAFVSGAQLLW